MLEQSEEVAGEIALEEPGGIAAALPLGDPSCDVVLGRRVVLASVELLAEGAHTVVVKRADPAVAAEAITVAAKEDGW